MIIGKEAETNIPKHLAMYTLFESLLNRLFIIDYIVQQGGEVMVYH